MSRLRSASRAAGSSGSRRGPDAGEHDERRRATAPSTAAPRCDAAGLRASAMIGCPAATAPPVAPMKVSPSSVMSCCRAICGDASFVSPTFLTITASRSSGAGNVCARSSDAAVDGQLARHLDGRLARRKRPADASRACRWRCASGDDPSRSVVPCAPAGMSNANGVGGFTGALRAVHDVEQVVDVDRFVARLDDDARLAADHDLAGHGRRAAPAARRPLCRSPPASGGCRPAPAPETPATRDARRRRRRRP